MKKWDRKNGLLVLAFLMVIDVLGMLSADMMHWNLPAFAHECGTMVMFAIMVFWVDYRKIIGFTLCLVDLIVFVWRSHVGDRSELWLIPLGLLVLYFVWGLVAVALKARTARSQTAIAGEAPAHLAGKSNG
jgi:hypothetical protein